MSQHSVRCVEKKKSHYYAHGTTCDPLFLRNFYYYQVWRYFDSNALSFYRSQNVLCRSKFFEPAQKFSAPSKKFVLAQEQFYWMQIIFLPGTKCLWLPQYVNIFLVWHKKFGPAQNILRLVKGQGINAVKCLGLLKTFGPAQNILGPLKGQGISISKYLIEWNFAPPSHHKKNPLPNSNMVENALPLMSLKQKE